MSDMTNNIYDAVIIGAGPAGLNAGLHLISSEAGAKVLLIDKATPWERPIPCAEGVGRLGFEESLHEIDPSWIRLAVNKVAFHAPSGASVLYESSSSGYILDRAKMQSDMAQKLASLGAALSLGVKVKSIGKLTADSTRQVQLDNGETISARVVIDASGPVSCFAKDEDICKPYDLESAYFAVCENVDCREDAINLFCGEKVAPGGYAWVFPRGNNVANIGLVIGRKSGVNIKTLLDNFLRKNFPSAKAQTYFAGAIPCGYRRGNIALPGLVKCGDAANVVNPISRAGISEALISGKLAAATAAEMLSATSAKQTKKICDNYERAWFKKRGERHLKLAKAKSSLAKVPDSDYDNAALALSKIPNEKRTLAKIFAVSLRRFPRIVWALRYFL